MDRFVHIAPLAFTKFPDPGLHDRTGPALTRGNVFTLLATVASDDLSAEALARIKELDVDSWYPGQDFETLINQLEDKEAALPEIVGRNLNFMFRTHLEAAGMLSAEQVLAKIDLVWLIATRGDSGVWRSRKLAERHFEVEAEQPYNCMLETGGVRGFIESFDGREVQILHRTCRRRGDACCTFDVRWEE